MQMYKTTNGAREKELIITLITADTWWKQISYKLVEQTRDEKMNIFLILTRT